MEVEVPSTVEVTSSPFSKYFLPNRSLSESNIQRAARNLCMGLWVVGWDSLQTSDLCPKCGNLAEGVLSVF